MRRRSITAGETPAQVRVIIWRLLIPNPALRKSAYRDALALTGEARIQLQIRLMQAMMELGRYGRWYFLVGMAGYFAMIIGLGSIIPGSIPRAVHGLIYTVLMIGSGWWLHRVFYYQQLTLSKLLYRSKSTRLVPYLLEYCYKVQDSLRGASIAWETLFGPLHRLLPMVGPEEAECWTRSQQEVLPRILEWDIDIAQAAARLLGTIGGPSAISALQDVQQKVDWPADVPVTALAELAKTAAASQESIRARMERGHKAKTLLRASEPDRANDGSKMLRAASVVDLTSLPSELLRAPGETIEPPPAHKGI